MINKEIKISLKSLKEEESRFKDLLIQYLYNEIRKISNRENLEISFYFKDESGTCKEGCFVFEYAKEIKLKIEKQRHIDIINYTSDNGTIFAGYCRDLDLEDLLKVVNDYLNFIRTIIRKWQEEKEKVENLVNDPRFAEIIEQMVIKKLKGGSS